MATVGKPVSGKGLLHRMQQKVKEARGTENSITIDANSGISLDEQRAIIAQINDLGEKNRRTLAASAKGSWKKRVKANKNGGLFPILVNALAVAVLVGGFMALYLFQGEVDTLAREGVRRLNPLERELIESIRRETSALLLTTDNEIAALLYRMTIVENRLEEVYADYETPEQERLLTEEYLVARLEEYRAALEYARRERIRILDTARNQEAEVQAQVEARTIEVTFQDRLEGREREATLQAHIATRIRDLIPIGQPGAPEPEPEPVDWVEADEPEYTDENAEAPDDTDLRFAELDAARAELLQLSVEQRQSAAVEALIAAFFANINAQISENRPEDAAHTIGVLRVFLDDPAFQGFRALRERRDLYIQAADALESLLETNHAINEALLAIAETPVPDFGLRLEISRLEEELAAKEYAISSATVESERAVAQLGNDVNILQAANTSLSTQLSGLQSTNTTLNARLSELQSTNTTLNAQLSGLQSANAALDLHVGDLQAINAELYSRLEALQSANAALGSRVGILEQDARVFQAINTSLYNQLNQLRQAVLSQ